MITGAGRNQPSVHIWIIDGQTLAGSGNHQSLESGVAHQTGQFQAEAGTILTSFIHIHATAIAHVHVVSVIVTVGLLKYPEPALVIQIVFICQLITVA